MYLLLYELHLADVNVLAELAHLAYGFLKLRLNFR